MTSSTIILEACYNTLSPSTLKNIMPIGAKPSISSSAIPIPEWYISFSRSFSISFHLTTQICLQICLHQLRPEPGLSIGVKIGGLGRLPRRKCWNLKDGNPAHEVWKIISNSLKTLVDDQMENLDVDNEEFMVEMFMTGKDKSDSRPTNLFSCKKESCQQTAMVIVNKAAILAPYLGVVMAECSRLPRLLRLLGSDEMLNLNLEPGVYQESPSISESSSILVVGNAAESPSRRATMGGIIRIGTKLHGLTVMYAFSAAPSPLVDDDSDDEFAFIEDSDLRGNDEEERSVDVTSRGRSAIYDLLTVLTSSGSMSSDSFRSLGTGGHGENLKTTENSSQDSIPESSKPRARSVVLPSASSRIRQVTPWNYALAVYISQHPNDMVGSVPEIRSHSGSGLDWAAIELLKVTGISQSYVQIQSVFTARARGKYVQSHRRDMLRITPKYTTEYASFSRLPARYCSM